MRGSTTTTPTTKTATTAATERKKHLYKFNWKTNKTPINCQIECFIYEIVLAAFATATATTATTTSAIAAGTTATATLRREEVGAARKGEKKKNV